MEAVAVDWSGAKDPRRRLWLARASDSQLLELRSGVSRERVVRALIELRESSTEHLVIGIDFSFSLPAWFLEDKGLRTARQLWELVDRVGESWLESCEPPFWGRRGKFRPEPRGALQAHRGRLQPSRRDRSEVDLPDRRRGLCRHVIATRHAVSRPASRCRLCDLAL
jgi:hypothetical protein